MSAEEQPQKETNAVQRLITETWTMDCDGPGLAALVKAMGPEAARRARTGSFGWDGPLKAFLKKYRALIYALLAAGAQGLFSVVPEISPLLTGVLVYGYAALHGFLRTIAEAVDETNGRLSVLRYAVADHMLNDEAWKWKSGIEIKDPRRITGADIIRRILAWDGETSMGSKENRARWSIMKDTLDPED